MTISDMNTIANSTTRCETPLFRVIIAGSRDFADYSTLRGVCNNILADKSQTHRIVIISGGAAGADLLGEEYAREKGYEVRQFPADWKQFGIAAGCIRNGEMADNADGLIAFWNGKSRGTKNMIDTAKRKNLPARTIMV